MLLMLPNIFKPVGETLYCLCNHQGWTEDYIYKCFTKYDGFFMRKLLFISLLALAIHNQSDKDHRGLSEGVTSFTWGHLLFFKPQ